MLIEQTAVKLRTMKLGAMAAELETQMDNPSFLSLSFEERFSHLVDAEWSARNSSKQTRLATRATFTQPSACLENIRFNDDRRLNQALINRLGTCKFIDLHRNVILLGATGSGKTYIASAIGKRATQSYYSVKYVRLPDMISELLSAKIDTAYFRKLSKSYAQVDLLILDEWLMYPLDAADRHILFEIMNLRERASTIFCSQYMIDGWHERIGEPILADSLIDRFKHSSDIIQIQGSESMRKILAADCEA